MDDQLSSAEKEVMKGKHLPGQYSNRFTVQMGTDVTRITFGERLVGDEITYRQAIVMPTSEARELARIINSLSGSKSSA